MRLLAVSYMLPPMLYPQAIQIGRLLAHVDAEIGAVSGAAPGFGKGLDCYTDLDRKLVFHLGVPYRPRLGGMAFYLARRFLPFYGRIPDEFRAWVPLAEEKTVATLSEAAFRPDAIVTFGEPMSDHLLGIRLQRRLGLPWVAHFSDPWFDNPFRARDVLANRINRRREYDTIAAADRVIFTSRETLDLVMAKYPPEWRNKTDVLPHSFDPALYPARSATKRGPIVVRHLGNFYGARTPYPLFRALCALWDRDRPLLDGISVELFGRVPLGMGWHPSWRALPEGLVTVKGTVPYSESLRLMSDADLLLVMDAPAELSVFLPSKLVDYLGSGTPIMGIVPPGTSASLIARLGGITADPRSPENVVSALARAITAAKRRDGSEVSRLWGDERVRSEFHPDQVAAAFFDMVRHAARSARAA
jgi:glycosyltransferase involved in cell wall biosynthesis